MIANPLLPALAHLWESTLFAAVAGLLAVLLRSSRAHIRYWIWFGASVKFLLPFSLLLSLGGLLGRMVSAGAPLANPSPSAAALLSLINQAGAPLAGPVAQWGATVQYANAALAFAAFIWMAGFLVQVSRRILAWFRMRSLVRDASPLQLPNVPLPAFASSGIEQVAVFGVVKPVLLLPDGIASVLTATELDAVLRHELAHAQRRDNLTATVHMAVEALFWFYPLVWWLGARLIAERERACDEEVLLSGVAPQAYAEGLLKVCDFYLAAPSLSAAGVNGGSLRSRIEAITARRVAGQLSLAKQLALAIAAVAALAVPIGIGIMQAPRLQAQSIADLALGPRFAAITLKATGLSRPMNSLDLSILRGFQGSQNGALDLRDTTLDLLIQLAYGIDASQLAQGPSWTYADRFAVTAKTDSSVSPEQMRPLIRSLLADRFKLTLHREGRKLPGHALSVAPGGVKLTPAGEGSCLPWGRTKPGELPCGTFRMMILPKVTAPNAKGRIEAVALSMPKFVELIKTIVPGLVQDHTGITGTYSFQLDFEPAKPGDQEPPIITAIERQLGLRLSPASVPADVLVIDGVEKPQQN